MHLHVNFLYLNDTEHLARPRPIFVNFLTEIVYHTVANICKNCISAAVNVSAKV